MDYIPYFIHEDIYLIEEENPLAALRDGQEAEENLMENDNALPYEGKNLKKILVLTSNDNADFLAEGEKIFLEKILGALGLNFEDIAIVNAAKIKDGMAAKISKFDCHYIISFGAMNDHPISNKTTSYEVIKQEEVTFLLADPLPVIEGDESKKRQLWNVLKHLFSV